MSAAQEGRAGTAAAAEATRERRGLRLSAVAAGAVGVGGVLWGLVSASSAILLDGAYALVGMGLSLLTLRVTSLVAAGPTHRYPFGREALAPVVVGVQGLVLLGTLLYASIDALLTLRSGGSDAEVGWALAYAVASLLLSLVLVAALRGAARTSELVAAEAVQWRAGAVLSAVLAVGFAVAVGLDASGLGQAARYVDPALVLVATAVLLPTPLRMMRSASRELLEAAPDPEVSGPVHDAVSEVGARLGLPDPTLRVGKVGRKLYVELDYLVPEGRWQVGDADRVRRELTSRLAAPERLLWVNVELHTDPDWDH
jgi:predicted Co/Zn/Cd cation transporter (cation efflux family)